jgi:hypothetical protein
MLDLYYHLHDDDKTMMELAKSGVSDLVDCHFEDILRTVGESKISNNPQVPELQELMDVISANKEITERAGFEPAVLYKEHTGFRNRLVQPLRHLSVKKCKFKVQKSKCGV